MFLVAVSLSIIGQMLVVYFPPLQHVFQTEALTVYGKIKCILLVILILIICILKLFRYFTFIGLNIKCIYCIRNKKILRTTIRKKVN